MSTHEMCEGIEGYYIYHLREPGKTKSLCGHDVMHTGVRLSDWGHVGHLDERYCDECKNIAEKP